MMPSKRNTLPMPCWSIGNNISSIPTSCLQYPNQLSDAHIDAGTDFRRVFYRKSAEEMPILFYRTTFIPFDTYRYNFVTQQSE